MTDRYHDAVRADIPDAVVPAVLEEPGRPDDRNAIQEDVNVQPGCHWDLAADVARAAIAARNAH